MILVCCLGLAEGFGICGRLFFFFKVCESKLALGPMGTGQVGGRAGQNCRDKVVTGLGGGQEHKQNKQHKQQISPGQRLEGMGRRELQLGG